SGARCLHIIPVPENDVHAVIDFTVKVEILPLRHTGRHGVPFPKKPVQFNITFGTHHGLSHPVVSAPAAQTPSSSLPASWNIFFPGGIRYRQEVYRWPASGKPVYIQSYLPGNKETPS